MVRKVSLGIGCLALAILPLTAQAAAIGYNLQLTVPVFCSVRHQPTGSGIVDHGAISLGTFREYCNAPGGYEVVVNYAPGSLRGATLIAGSDVVVLNGSGQAVLSHTTGPRVRERIIAAIPGENGFDTDRLDIQILPI
ncbi:hypothetical protein SAMN06295987_11144 [Novosphingobium mathurense]|uniref:Uncharacterized protein n=2 Tax=Novosphingobium mathurense TaxID=428990 RepID=A0A1U6IQQ7_9SPHN|nr:hypothetical protein SAMN06295987_11144 [Novosphingobium mathurense]